MQARFGLLGAVAGFGPPGHTRVSLGGMNMVIHKRGFYEERDCVACHRGSSTTDGPDHGLDAVRVRGSGGHSCLSTRKPDACAGARGAGTASRAGTSSRSGTITSRSSRATSCAVLARLSTAFSRPKLWAGVLRGFGPLRARRRVIPGAPFPLPFPILHRGVAAPFTPRRRRPSGSKSRP